VAAPFATRHLADLGARVIKIERPQVGDFARDYDQTVNGLSSHSGSIVPREPRAGRETRAQGHSRPADRARRRFHQNLRLAPPALGLSADDLLS
jgi:crotonobetainyl-CoA:carnitine CoA-transferase CaiB-like acyl-CoA transferase